MKRWYDHISINLFWLGLNIRNTAIGSIFLPYLVDVFAPEAIKNTALGFMRTAGLLIAMLVVSSFQAFYVEPKAAELKRQIGSFETTTKEHPLRREFSKLHGISAVCNLAVLAGGVVLVVLP